MATNNIINRNVGYEFIATATASSSAAIAFTGLSSTYIAYKVIMTNVVSANDAVELYLRTSTNGGSSYDAGASDYAWGFVFNTLNTATVATTVGADEADDSITIFNSFGTGANESGAIEVTIFNPSAAAFCRVNWSGLVTASDAGHYNVTGAGARLAAADVDAIQFIMSAGNIASGEFRLYGLRGV